MSQRKGVHIPHQNSDHPQRYIILDDIKDEAKWKDCQVTSVVCSKKDIPQMFLDQKALIEQQADKFPISADTIKKKETNLDKKTAETIQI